MVVRKTGRVLCHKLPNGSRQRIRQHERGTVATIMLQREVPDALTVQERILAGRELSSGSQDRNLQEKQARSSGGKFTNRRTQ